MEQLHLFLRYLLAVIWQAAILHFWIDQMVSLEQTTILARVEKENYQEASSHV